MLSSDILIITESFKKAKAEAIAYNEFDRLMVIPEKLVTLQNCSYILAGQIGLAGSKLQDFIEACDMDFDIDELRDTL